MTQRKRTGMLEWPFLPIQELENGDRLAEWRAQCHVPAPFDDLLADPQRSVVVITHPGCGLSTSLRLLQDEPLLLLPYPVSQWPEQRGAFNSRPDHFGQWMGQVAYAFERRLRERPGQIGQLRDYHFEFLAWLTRHYLGPRQARSLLHLLEKHLPAQRVQPLQVFVVEAEPPELFHETVSGILGQIGEALDIAEQLGFRGIFACVELSLAEWIKASAAERVQIQHQLRELLSALTPLSRSEFGIKVGIPELIMRPEQARGILRDRATVTVANWDADRIFRLVDRLLGAAMPDTPPGRSSLVPYLLRELHPDIQSIYGRPGPEVVRLIARTVGEADPAEAEATVIQRLRLALYEHGARLRVDGDASTRRVWRGAHSIVLSDNHFELFELLWRHQGDYANPETLLSLGGTKTNVDQMVTRLRKLLEPPIETDQRLYIHRDRKGALLRREHCDFS